MSETCEAEKITSLVKRHVPKVQVSQHHETELTFMVPFESMDAFPGLRPNNTFKQAAHRSLMSRCLFFIGLFSELDLQHDLGVINYGVSMTTLEDVFLRLEAENEVDQAGEFNHSLLLSISSSFFSSSSFTSAVSSVS